MVPRAFHVMAKPTGPVCNLSCRYCYYLEKRLLYPDATGFRMPDSVLEEFIRRHIEAQGAPQADFAWQGGEPTLLGLEFFERVVELQGKHAPPGKRVTNAFQTNGTLLDEAWCGFFKEHGFLIGLSIDGPREMHDHYRVDRGGRPTFDRVMRGMSLLKRHGVDFNTLTVVHNYNARRPEKVYEFLREEGSGYMQFIPLVERAGDGTALAHAPVAGGETYSAPVTRWSVDPQDYGEFLCGVFDEWVRNDVGRCFVPVFDCHLASWLGMSASLCVFGEMCGNALLLEHNGDLYSCDHYVYPDNRLGNIMETPLRDLVESEPQRKFGDAKRDSLPRCCRACDFLFACRGDCPKHRFVPASAAGPGEDGTPRLSYLCPAYKRFFRHADPHMRVMADLVRRRRPAAEVMEEVRLNHG